MKILVALGNPGDKYITTRHNVGFLYADALAYKWDCNFRFESKFNAEIAKCEFENEQIWIIKPQTFMNLSGNAVREFLKFYKYSEKDVFVVYDDISLDLGTLRFRPCGSDGGHNGIKSIITNIGTQKFDRLKIGIGPQPEMMASESFVLGAFSKEEIEILKPTLVKAVEATEYYILNDISKVQNRYNKK